MCLKNAGTTENTVRDEIGCADDYNSKIYLAANTEKEEATTPPNEAKGDTHLGQVRNVLATLHVARLFQRDRIIEPREARHRVERDDDVGAAYRVIS